MSYKSKQIQGKVGLPKIGGQFKHKQGHTSSYPRSVACSLRSPQDVTACSEPRASWSPFPLAQAAVSFMPVGVQWTSCIITSLGTFLLVDSPWPALCLRSLSWKHRSFVTRRYTGDSPRLPSGAHYWAFVSPDKVPS